MKLLRLWQAFLPKHGDSGYTSFSGYTVQREFGQSPNGNPLNGAWVLRKNDEYIDHDRYRNDLAERRNLVLLDEPYRHA